MPAFPDALQGFCAGLADLPGGEFANRINGLLQALPEMTPEDGQWAAGALVPMLARNPKPRVSVVGVFGDLLCRGVNFWGYLPYYLAALGRSLDLARDFEQAVGPLVPAGKSFRELPPEEGQAILERLPESARDGIGNWVQLEFCLGPAMAILEQVAPARQLARAMGLSVGWLADSRLGANWIGNLPKIFETADDPPPDQSSVIDEALADVHRQSTRRLRSREPVHESLQPIFQATTFVPPEVFDRTAAELARIAADADPDWAGELAGVVGAFCERGADPNAGANALIAGLPRLLDPVVAFVGACKALPTPEDQSALEVHGEAVSRKMPDARRALDAIAGYCLGTIAHLARSSAARQRHGRRTDLLAKLDAVRWDTPNTGFLWKMLQVIDEELVILAPEFRLGWRVRIDGVADNFQLHALIAGHLVGPLDDGKYPGIVGTHDQPERGPGVPISPRALATQMNAPCTGREPGFSSRLQLWNWTALQKDGTLPAVPTDFYEHFVWNEGVPADIRPFAGTRVVLLGPTNLHRNWNGGRIFPFMEATFRVVETLTPEAAGAWLRRLAGGEAVSG